MIRLGNVDRLLVGEVGRVLFEVSFVDAVDVARHEPPRLAIRTVVVSRVRAFDYCFGFALQSESLQVAETVFGQFRHLDLLHFLGVMHPRLIHEFISERLRLALIDLPFILLDAGRIELSGAKTAQVTLAGIETDDIVHLDLIVRRVSLLFGVFIALSRQVLG